MKVSILMLLGLIGLTLANVEQEQIPSLSLADERDLKKYRLKKEAVIVSDILPSKCVDLHMENRNVYMHDCHFGNNQRWAYTKKKELKSLHKHVCLEYNPEDVTDNDGINVRTGACTNAKNQKWVLQDETIRPLELKGFCLNVYVHNLVLWPCNNKRNQKFELFEKKN